jgi:hypothetical protein
MKTNSFLSGAVQGAWKQLIANAVLRLNALVVTSSDRGAVECLVNSRQFSFCLVTTLIEDTLALRRELFIDLQLYTSSAIVTRAFKHTR